MTMRESHSERSMEFPSVNSLLKISLGLILLVAISFALVYAQTITVNVEEDSFDIKYNVTGMTVSSVTVDADFISLILTVDVTDSSGTLDITLERSLLDSIYEGSDDDFIVVVEAEEPGFSETMTSAQSRTLSISVPAGAEEIEIIGTVLGNTASIEDDEDAKAKAAQEAAKAAEDKAADEAAKAAAEAKAANDAAKAAEAKAAEDKAAKEAAAKAQAAKDAASTCAPGTILKDGICILDSTSQQSSFSIKALGKETLMGVIVAFVVAGTIGIILGLISKASKSH